MNLVAKEFVSAKADDKGALVLSRFTGASRQLQDAFLVNPYNTEETSEAIFKALTINETAKKKRMKKLRQTVQRDDIWKWIGQIASEIPQEE